MFVVIKDSALEQRDIEITPDERVLKVLGTYNTSYKSDRGKIITMYACTKLKGLRPKRRYREDEIKRFIKSDEEALLMLGAYSI